MTNRYTIDPEAMAESALHWIEQGKWDDAREDAPPRIIRRMQDAVYVMCGGGMLGSFAARNPARFYIDTRVGRLPYSRRDIMQAVHVLTIFATAAGLDPKNLPEPPSMHNMGGVF